MVAPVTRRMLRMERAATLGGILTHDAMIIVLDNMSVWDVVPLRAVSKGLRDSPTVRDRIMWSWKDAKSNVYERPYPFSFIHLETKKGMFKKMIILGRVLFGKSYYYWQTRLDVFTSEEAEADKAGSEELPVLSSAVKYTPNAPKIR
ncbi:hypothetical protein OAO87_00130 [bacterium]|nr:hypothetical protein [bacterium]